MIKGSILDKSNDMRLTLIVIIFDKFRNKVTLKVSNLLAISCYCKLINYYQTRYRKTHENSINSYMYIKIREIS